MGKSIGKFEPTVRYTNGLRIYFKDKFTVQASKGASAIYISRWGINCNGLYKSSWRPFCDKLCRINSLKSLYDVMNLAQRYDLIIQQSMNGVEALPPDTRVRPETYIRKDRIVEDKDYDVLIYSKWCTKCEKTEELQELNYWAMREGLTYKIIRTAYRPSYHKKATELWAAAKGLSEEEAEDYPTFVVYNDVTELREFVKMIKDAKNKMVTEGETKDDVQRLPKASRAKRKNCVVTSDDENNEKD